MSRLKFSSAKKSKKAELLSALSFQVRTLILNALKQKKFDQMIIDEMHLATRAICHFEENANSDQPGSKVVDKEGRALRGLLNQIEERIEVLAQQNTNDIITRKNRATISGENFNRGTVEASTSPTAAATK